MLTHLFKIIRTQFRSNLWILAELMVVYLVIWITGNYFVNLFTTYNQPVGFKTDHVYLAEIFLRPADSPKFISYGQGSEEPLRNFEHILERLRQHPDVEAVACALFSLPYTTSNSTYALSNPKDSASIITRMLNVTPGYFKVFDIYGCNGEKPETLDRLLEDSGLIISLTTARTLFGRSNVKGEKLTVGGDSIPRPVLAVTEATRNDEYNTRLPHSQFHPLYLKDIMGNNPEENLKNVQIVFRINPNIETNGYAEKFTKEMSQQLQAGNFTISGIQEYDSIRQNFLRIHPENSSSRLITVIGLFLLGNVFLAVIGTFWFRINRRHEEIGIRRAIGSSRKQILQITWLESLLLLTIAAIPALFICANLVGFDIVPGNTILQPFWQFIGVSILTWSILAGVIALAIWYPTWKATETTPADALHYE